MTLFNRKFNPFISDGDIEEKSFSMANNQSSAANITDFVFANAIVRSFTAHCSLFVDATADYAESFDIIGIRNGTSWDVSISKIGADSGIELSINSTGSAGQLQYTSPDFPGFVSATFKFRAVTTSS